MAKRRPRKRLTRRGPEREPYDRVLIVCEGKCTEPLYVQDLAAHYRLSTANVVITGEGADPRTVVRVAKKLRSVEGRQGEKYDRVYCVFDRDEHMTFRQACDEARASGICIARSWPCFEFWFRLHFGFSRQPYFTSGGRTAAQRCVDELRGWLPGYEKGASGIFHALDASLESAMDNANRALADAKATGDFNPSTEVHHLVDYLQKLKSKQTGNQH
ncbi:MAG: RloB family protein [Immundisolibacterales bacterium]|nr:RloB family protein [Immundisolibacterales bacterium]